MTEDSLTDVTIENVLTDNLYNDLSFIANNKLMILIEAQSIWTLNIIIRALLYLAQTYHDYFERTNQNLYKRKKVKMPKPELYVVYVGNHKNMPDEISLSKEFFGGADIAIDVKVKVISESDTDSIINQYIIFSKVYDEEEVMRSYIKSERYEAEQNKVKEKASLMLKNGKITVDEMPIFSQNYLAKISERLRQRLCSWHKQISI